MYLKHTAFLATISLLLTWKSALTVKVTCDYIENVIGGKEDVDGVLKRPENTNGCVAQRNGKEYITTELQMTNSTIVVLKQNSIRNMPWLEAISCMSCVIYQINPGAFQNVSNLTILEFIYGSMTIIRRGVFDGVPKLSALDIRGNEISEIEDEAFANLPALQFINLKENKMGYWKREWFSNTPSLKTINFMKNQLRFIPAFAFTTLLSIQNLFFDNNRISVIHVDAFEGIKSINSLGLANNLLKTLSETIFPDKKITINILDLSENQLNYLPPETLKKLTVNEIYLEGNPWKCQCLKDIHFWLRYIDGQPKSKRDDPLCTGPNIPVCVSSSALTCIESVDSEVTSRYNAYPEVVRRKDNRLCTKAYANTFP